MTTQVPVDVQMTMLAKAGELLALSRELITASPVPAGMDIEHSINGGAVQSVLAAMSQTVDINDVIGTLADVVGMFCAQMSDPAASFQFIGSRAYGQMQNAIAAGVEFQPQDTVN